jgi:hypothetical protein
VSGLAERSGDLYHHQTMRRLLPILVLVAVAAVVSACDASFTPYAARVNGVSISQSTFTDELGAIASDAPLRCLIGTSTAIYGTGGTSTYATSFAATELSASIGSALIAGEVARRHLAITSLSRQIASAQIADELTPSQGSTCTTPGATVVAHFPPVLTSSLVDAQAETNVLDADLAGEPLTSSGAAAFARAHPRAAALQCISYIIVSSKATANQLEGAIADGASFANVAKASSLDTSTGANGGAFGCYAIDQLPTPLDTVAPTLAVGGVSAPTPFTSGTTTYYVIVKVTSRQASSSAAADELVAYGQKSESKLMATLARSAHVDVNPTYGSWKDVHGTYEVVANGGPPLALLGNQPAITPVPTP